MTWQEMMIVVDWMALRWSDVSGWSDDKVRAFYDDLQSWPVEAVQDAVKTINETGGRIPSGGVVIKTIRALGWKPAHDNTRHKHQWGIVEYEEVRDDGMRSASCAICKEGRLFRPSDLRTQSERDAIERNETPLRVRTSSSERQRIPDWLRTRLTEGQPQ